MPRFVLLRHETPPGHPRPSHWDLMLEHAGVLLTWELQTLPGLWAEALGEDSSDAEDTVEARRLSDHRLAYLEIEGPVSGGRGTVQRCDRGELETGIGGGRSQRLARPATGCGGRLSFGGKANPGGCWLYHQGGTEGRRANQSNECFHAEPP